MKVVVVAVLAGEDSWIHTRNLDMKHKECGSTNNSKNVLTFSLCMLIRLKSVVENNLAKATTNKFLRTVLASRRETLQNVTATQQHLEMLSHRRFAIIADINIYLVWT